MRALPEAELRRAAPLVLLACGWAESDSVFIAELEDSVPYVRALAGLVPTGQALNPRKAERAVRAET